MRWQQVAYSLVDQIIIVRINTIVQLELSDNQLQHTAAYSSHHRYKSCSITVNNLEINEHKHTRQNSQAPQ